MAELQDMVQDMTNSDKYWLELLGPEEFTPLKDYVETIANKNLRKYRSIVQWGKKEGQTYLNHILDGVMTLGRLCALESLGISDIEARCLFLAFTVHDLNKTRDYCGKSYADIATDENIAAELTSLDVSSFFHDWPLYLRDIGELARLHQGHLAVTLDGLDRRKRLALDELTQEGRVKQLGRLIQAVDELALSQTLDERANKDKFLFNLNAACSNEQYRFVTHRLSEYRGLLSNVIHNGIVGYLREKYPSCLDLLYYPDGVAYLYPKHAEVIWEDADVVAVAQRVTQRLARLQAGQLGQFIRSTNAGIKVDKAAIESGASASDLLDGIYGRVLSKRYTADREAEREDAVRRDIRKALDTGKPAPESAVQIQPLLALPAILPNDEDRRRCGEYLTAYRNLVDDHGNDLDLSSKDSWVALYQALELPLNNYPLYGLVHPYRRGYFVVRDLPTHLADVDALHSHFLKLLPPSVDMAEEPHGAVSDRDTTPLAINLTDYLRRTLLVSLAATTHDFSGYLREYVTARNRQCCYCSTMLPTQNWMTANAPPSIGVQSFSNRLEGGALREPKRQICPICRAQFILEKIAWLGHDSKMGLPKMKANGTKAPGYTTFYLYLYPRGYFTEPFLQTWIAEIKRLRDQDSTAFFINLSVAFRLWAVSDVGSIPIYLTKMKGVALPELPESSCNIPILPINAPGQNYGEQFLVALEKAVLLRSFFGCKVVLSRLPSSPIGATGLQTLFIDGVPRNLLWLVAGAASGNSLYEREANLTDGQVEALERRLQLLFRLRDVLSISGNDRDLIHYLAVETGDDPLRLYHALDRAIEEKVAASAKGGTRGTGSSRAPDAQATALSRMVVSIARELVKMGVPA